MTFSSYEIVEINAVVIIGLTILLSFQSITSTFIENDLISFFQTLRDDIIEFEKGNAMIRECQEFHQTPEKFEYRAKKILELDFEYEADRLHYQNITSSLEEACIKNAINIIELCHKINMSYVYAADLGYVKGKAVFNEGVYEIEGEVTQSAWFRDIATGPLKVVFLNVILVIPFAASAIVEIAFSLKTKETGNPASKLGTYLTIAGFVVMVIGFAVLSYFFYEANSVLLR